MEECKLGNRRRHQRILLQYQPPQTSFVPRCGTSRPIAFTTLLETSRGAGYGLKKEPQTVVGVRGVLSPMLPNIYLRPLDQFCEEFKITYKAPTSLITR